MAASCLSLCTVVLGTVLLTGVVLGVDKTVNNDATGADVVHAVIIKLSTCEKTNFHISDHHLLRRIAYVETKDGVVKNDKERKLYGIWAVDDVTFSITIKNISNVCGHLNSPGCLLSNLSFECARKPLYSGLIAKLYLRDYEQQIPTSDNITGQAMFWHNNYHGGGGGPEKFVNAVRDNITLLEGRSACVFMDNGCIIITAMLDRVSCNYHQMGCVLITYYVPLFRLDQWFCIWAYYRLPEYSCRMNSS